MLETKLEDLKKSLQIHPIYKELKSIETIKTFMEFHVFAVWDFMSLVKRLQNDLSCTKVPWRPSNYPGQMVRFINDIVMTEESDIDFDGEYRDHFTMYLNAMDEIGADTSNIKFYIQNGKANLATPVKQFVDFNISLSEVGSTPQVAAVFLYGRENLIPIMFDSIIKNIPTDICPKLCYYLERHIEIDGEEHGPIAHKLFEMLCPDQETKQDALSYAVKSLQLRYELWNGALEQIRTSNSRLSYSIL